jgi:predicted site-specific integrase-resolvase
LLPEAKERRENKVETTFLLFALVSSEARNAGLEKRIKGFEKLTENLSNEIDRRAGEAASLKRKDFHDSNSFLKAA